MVQALELPALALRGHRDLEVSSMCATFAETEIVSLLAQGRLRRNCRPNGASTMVKLGPTITTGQSQ
jgi:hypothetical protein